MVNFVSARRWFGRFVGMVCLVALSGVITACRAEGGARLGAPLPGPVLGEFQGDASVGFNFTCRVQAGKPVVRGQIEYHDAGASTFDDVTLPPIRLHGQIEPLTFLDAQTCEEVADQLPAAALFEGTYHPKDNDPALPHGAAKGEFVVQVFDQGEPARPGGDFTGDSFSIELIGGRYSGYTRGGYLEGGNVQVKPDR